MRDAKKSPRQARLQVNGRNTLAGQKQPDGIQNREWRNQKGVERCGYSF
jgi:hypothetical protein